MYKIPYSNAKYAIGKLRIDLIRIFIATVQLPN
jgi:hypothetical protein